MTADMIAKLEEAFAASRVESTVVTYSYFKGGAADTTPERRTSTLEELLHDHVRIDVPYDWYIEAGGDKRSQHRTKEQQEAQKRIDALKNKADAFVMGTFKEGGDRRKENMESYTGLVLDCDSLTESTYQDTVDKIEAAGFTAAIYSTFSNDYPQGKKVKIRIILPFETPLTASSWEDLSKNYKCVYSEVVSALKIPAPDAASKSVSQCFFLPSYMQLVSSTEYCHNPTHFISYIPGRFKLRYEFYLTTVDNRRFGLFRKMQEAWEKGECEAAASDLAEYARTKLVSQLESPESFKTETIPGIADYICKKSEWGKRSKPAKKSKGKTAGPSNLQLKEFIEKTEPYYFWRTYEYTFKNEHGVRESFNEASTPLQLAVWFEKETGHTVSIDKFKQFFFSVADSPGCRKDPFKERLERVEWDGKSRYGDLFKFREGTTHVEMRKDMVKKWLISVVARTMQERQEKVDTMLILHGGQGMRKSEFFRSLVGTENFSDNIHEISTQNLKDVMLTIRGKVLAEVSEMEKLFIKGQSLLKAFLSQACDDVRDPYERKIQRQIRKVVFVGSTNEDTFLTDRTGNRRYWVIPLAPEKMTRLTEAEADQVWAEAVYYFRVGMQWYYDTYEEDQMVESINEEYLPIDDLYVRVAGVVSEGRLPKSHFTGGMLCEVMCIDRTKYATHVTRCLKKLGFVYKMRKINKVPALGFNSEDRNDGSGSYQMGPS